MKRPKVVRYNREDVIALVKSLTNIVDMAIAGANLVEDVAQIALRLQGRGVVLPPSLKNLQNQSSSSQDLYMKFKLLRDQLPTACDLARRAHLSYRPRRRERKKHALNPKILRTMLAAAQLTQANLNEPRPCLGNPMAGLYR